MTNHANKSFSPDTDAILASILALDDAPALARESGANLVDEWMGRFGASDATLRIRAVELGFIIYVDSKTAVIGVQDMIAEDEGGVFGNEWKSAKEPKRYGGKDSAWWNEDIWLQEISHSAQVQIYALALNRGVFYEKDRGGIATEYGISEPRIRVRAAVKSNPVRFWPSSGTGVYRFTDTQLAGVEAGLRSKADVIRASRRVNIVPWQLTGKQCHAFGRPCQFLEQCRSGHYPVSGMESNDKLRAQFDMSDPAAELALPFIPQTLLNDPDFVVLSASQYTLHSDCAEKYRIINSHLGPKGSSPEQWVGTVMHAGLAEFYRQMRDSQDG
jgi:hypothetical protein